MQLQFSIQAFYFHLILHSQTDIAYTAWFACIVDALFFTLARGWLCMCVCCCWFLCCYLHTRLTSCSRCFCALDSLFDCRQICGVVQRKQTILYSLVRHLIACPANNNNIIFENWSTANCIHKMTSARISTEMICQFVLNILFFFLFRLLQMFFF